MTEAVSKSELIGIASQFTDEQRRSARIRAKSASPEGSTFLSHSSRDDELIDGAIAVLEHNGATVYIDEIDPEMPPYTSDETAAKLKKRVRQCNKFVLLASPNSKDSRWVPWELGIADGIKDLDKIAIFPSIDSTDDKWTSWEYIGLYRKIVWGNLEGHQKKVWMVWNKKTNKATKLSKWLGR